MQNYQELSSFINIPLFTKKDNIVLTAQEFTEKFTGESVSTQPTLYLSKEKIEKAKKNIILIIILNIFVLVFQQVVLLKDGILKYILKDINKK